MADLRVSLCNVNRLDVEQLGERAPLGLCGWLLGDVHASVPCNVEHGTLDKV